MARPLLPKRQRPDHSRRELARQWYSRQAPSWRSTNHQGVNLLESALLAMPATESGAEHPCWEARKVVRNVWWCRKDRDAPTLRYGQQFESILFPSAAVTTRRTRRLERLRHWHAKPVVDRQQRRGFPSSVSTIVSESASAPTARAKAPRTDG